VTDVARAPSAHFVVIEGIDGAGTTTHARRLVEALTNRGRDVRLTCEPSDGPIGSLIRRILKHEVVLPDGRPRPVDWATMALLFAADRLDHVRAVIAPALAEGTVVVSDRYDLSSLAYQSVTAPAPDAALPWIRELNRDALRPDLTIVLDVPAEVAEKRRGGRSGRAELFEASDIQRRVAELYRQTERLVPGDRTARISSDADADEVAARVLAAFDAAG
jgi:dTMP kinase